MNPESTENETSDVKPFLDHLDDLRTVLLRSLATLVAAMLVAFPNVPWIVASLKKPLLRLTEYPDEFLQSMEVMGAFTTALRIAFWGGLFLAAPFLVFFIGAFIFPGLVDRERALVKKSSGFALLLFFSGVMLAYFIILPVALQMMHKMHFWMGVNPLWTINSYVAFCIQLMIGFGLAFELPVVLVILGKLGVVNAEMLAAKRKIVFVIMLIAAMILTPPDVFTQVLMALPLFGLYEISVMLLRADERRKDN